MMLGGLSDPLVKPAWQQMMKRAIIKDNHCTPTPKPWSDNRLCLIYPSKTGTPLVTFFFPGGHQFDCSAPPLIVKFFKEYPKR